MAGKPDRFSRFWQELKRRKTDRVIVMYAASAFVILQVAQILTDALSLPGWTIELIIIILAIGFPVVILFSWFFDITPGGIEKTKPLTKKDRETIRTQLKTWKEITMASFVVIVLLIFFNIVRGRIETLDIKKTEKSIAVLPFENLSPDEIMPYPGTVVTSIITNGLSQIKEFAVMPRFIVQERYKKERSLTDNGKRLNVFFVVTGELIKDKNNVLINVNLIRVRKEKVLWASSFPISGGETFDQLSDIAIQISKALKTVISPEVKRKINLKPTEVSLAYINYMEGNADQEDATNGYFYLSRGDSTFKDVTSSASFERAISFYDKAIQADTNFALAYAKRAIARSWGVHTGHLDIKDQKEKCRNDIEKALHIKKDLTEARIAFGFYYYYLGVDYDKAMEYFREVSIKEPESWQCKFFMALVLRVRGEWRESQKLMAEVVRYNPQDALYITNIGLSYNYIHDYDSAVYFHDRAIRIMPKWSAPYENKLASLIMRDGTTKEAEAVLDSSILNTSGGKFPRDKILIDLYNKKYDEALFKAEKANSSDFYGEGDRYLVFAEIYDLLKNREFAKKYYKSAFEFFRNIILNNGEDPGILGMTGIAAAGLGDKRNAIEYGQKAIDLTVKNQIDKSDRIMELAQIYAMVGENAKSLKLIEELLSNPSSLSTGLLRLDPVWIPLQSNPEYKVLITKYSKK